MEIEWEDPPPTAKRTGNRPGRYMAFALALREHQGRWAKLPTEGSITSDKSADSLAQSIRRGVSKGFAKGEYDTAVEGTSIWVQFTGPVEPAEAGDDADHETHEAPAVVDRLAPLVRAWAAENGIAVGERGRLPQQLVEDYLSAQQEKNALRAVD